MKFGRLAAFAIVTLVSVIGVDLNTFANDCTQVLQATVNPLGGSGIHLAPLRSALKGTAQPSPC